MNKVPWTSNNNLLLKILQGSWIASEHHCKTLQESMVVTGTVVVVVFVLVLVVVVVVVVVVSGGGGERYIFMFQVHSITISMFWLMASPSTPTLTYPATELAGFDSDIFFFDTCSCAASRKGPPLSEQWPYVHLQNFGHTRWVMSETTAASQIFGKLLFTLR